MDIVQKIYAAVALLGFAIAVYGNDVYGIGNGYVEGAGIAFVIITALSYFVLSSAGAFEDG